ncbi:ATP-binding protein [Shewanella sp. GD03713]|uniref:ATP-binding protein n=1 Tax=Shewanella sp. GD03713 TaxID=2975372 RepID=UPI002113F6FD|nr:ATP-binding protein [Shewanella sp. GD03713]MDH1471144.1 ATP-binding protein [Shewanella sp. GD03713]
MLAFASMTFLNLFIGITTVLIWEELSNKINHIVEHSLPPLNGAYMLERSSGNLQSIISNSYKINDELGYQNFENDLKNEIDTIKQAYISSNPDRQLLPEQRLALEHFSRLIEQQDTLLKQKIAYSQELDNLQKRITWLHQDLNDEMTPLMQEVEWHVTRLLSHPVDNLSPNALMNEFFILQELSTKETELFTLVNEIIDQRYTRELTSAFSYLDQKIAEIETLVEKLTSFPSTISHRQIMKNLITLISSNGELIRLLKLDTQAQLALSQLAEPLTQVLTQFHLKNIATLEQSSQAFNSLNTNTKSMIINGKLIIVLISIISIVISVLVLAVLIRQRVLKRLNTLEIDLKNVADGHLDWPITTQGKDEIGHMGDCLRQFCVDMQAMVKSNALTLINNAQASLITCHPNGEIESANPHALQLLSLSTLAPQLTLWQAFPAACQPQLLAQFAADSELSRTGQSECILNLVKHNAPQYLHFHLQAFEHARQAKYMVTITDITKQELNTRELERLVADRTLNLTVKNQELTAEIEQRKLAEAHLHQAQADLIQAAKMAAVGQTMTSLAHELNQPLSAVSTYLYSCRLALETNQLELLTEMLSKTEKMNLRMAKIISAIRNFARKSPTQVESVSIDINQLVNNALVLVETRARNENIIIHNELTKEYLIQVDAVQVEQVLLNILINAMDATASQADKHIYVTVLEQSAAKLTLAIYDNGPGFAPSILPQIFTPFTTTKAVGLGLGLSICRSILERFNADIYLASHLNGGAMIILEFRNAD